MEGSGLCPSSSPSHAGADCVCPVAFPPSTIISLSMSLPFTVHEGDRGEFRTFLIKIITWERRKYTSGHRTADINRNIFSHFIINSLNLVYSNAYLKLPLPEEKHKKQKHVLYKLVPPKTNPIITFILDVMATRSLLFFFYGLIPAAVQRLQRTRSHCKWNGLHSPARSWKVTFTWPLNCSLSWNPEKPLSLTSIHTYRAQTCAA